MRYNLRSRLRKLTILAVAILMLNLLSACSARSAKMSHLDKHYDQLANKAASTLLQSEAEGYTWTTVETGDLQYLHSAKNASNDRIQVHYLAKFDAADEPEAEWTELIISLDGKTETVTDTAVNYWTAEQYAVCFGEKYNYNGFIWSMEHGREGWFNVNLTDEEYAAAKEEFDGLYASNNNILDAMDYMIEMLGEPYKPEYAASSTGEYLPSEPFVIYVASDNHRGYLFYGKSESEEIIASVYWRSDYKEAGSFDALASELATRLGQEPKDYTRLGQHLPEDAPLPVGFAYRDIEILLAEFDDYIEISVFKLDK